MHETTTAAATVFTEKATGAIVGSAISIGYILPSGRREAAIRFFAGVAAGLVFGTTVGVKLAKELGIAETLSEGETVLMGSAVASMTIWWAIGFLLRATKAPVNGHLQSSDQQAKPGQT